MATNTLLEFLLGLFANPGAAQHFRDDPEDSLDSAGLGDLCTADVESVMPVLHDYGPISFDRHYDTGGNGMTGNGGGGGGGGGAMTDHAHAVQQLTHVLNQYSYTIDDRDTILDQSTNQNIWADGDVTQLFDQDAVIASGDHANAAGDDVNVEDSYNDSHDVTDSYNMTDSNNDNSDNSVHIEDSGNDNSDNSVHIEDSGNDNSDHSDNSDNSVHIEDSGNDHSDHSVDMEYTDNSDHSVENTDDHSTEVDVEVDVEDSFNHEYEYEDKSYTQNNTDSTVVQDNETEVEESVILVP